MVQNKILSLAGLAARAGKIASGEFAAEQSVKAQKAFLVLVAGDASANTKKKFYNMCAYYKVPFYILDFDRAALGKAVGKEFRACLAVLDAGLSGALEKSIREQAQRIQEYTAERKSEKNGDGSQNREEKMDVH